MKVSTLSLLAVALIGISQAAVADTKIGFVNSDRVMREAAPAVRAQAATHNRAKQVADSAPIDR